MVTIDDARAVPQPPGSLLGSDVHVSLAAGHLILVPELRSALAELGRLDTRLTVVDLVITEQERAMISQWRYS